MKYLSLKKVIEVLADWDVIHIDFNDLLKNPKEDKDKIIYGICYNDKKIYINSAKRLDARRGCLIHELIHAFYFMKDKDEINTEKNVKKIEKATYNKLFRKK